MTELLNQFSAYLLTEKRVSTNTFDSYRRDIQQFYDFLKALNKSFDTAQEADIQPFLFHLKKKNCSARSMARKISALKLFYKWSIRTGRLSYNIIKDTAAPKIQKKLPTFLTEQEIERIFGAAQQIDTTHAERNKIMLYLLYATGSRITELIQMNVSDIFFDTGFIAIRGKGNKARLVPIPYEIMDLLKMYLQKQSVKEQQQFLFPIKYGKTIKHISRQSFWLILRKICKQAHINKTVSPHTLRHSFATHLLKKGAHLRALQLLLGHEQLTTVQIYTHLETSHLREIYDKKHPRA